jgi:non-ribosomal peptide synthetase component E (peptide arylation enzyme)
MPITRNDTILTSELIEKYTAAGYWTTRTLADVFHQNAQEIPGKIAYSDCRSHVTWSDLWRISGEVASGLSRRGVRAGDVVAVQLPNRIEFVFVLAAVVRLGAVFCQYPPDYRAGEVEFILRFSEAHTLVVPDQFRDFDFLKMIDDLRDRLPQLVNTVVVPLGTAPAKPVGDGWVTLDQLRGDRDLADPEPNHPRDANEVMRIAFTSGTTGEPKAVMHTTTTTLFCLEHAAKLLKIDRDANVLVLMPVGLNMGFSAVVATGLAGAHAILVERFNPTTTLDLIEKYKVTTFTTPPTALVAILNEKSLNDRNLSSLRLVQTGGQSTLVKVLREANDRLGCPVIDIYGMLEVGLTSSTDETEPYQEWVGTVGRPYPFMEVRILGPDDRDVPVGTEGEIVKSGPTIMVGYYRNPAKNAESWTSDGWFRSGDRGYIDRAGRLTISGRSKDMIIHGGANIWPRELEEVLIKHSQVADVAMIGIHDDYYGENVCACVIPKDGAHVELHDVIDFMKSEVAKYKLPQHLEIFSVFPIGPTGKVVKRELAVEVERRRKAVANGEEAPV